MAKRKYGIEIEPGGFVFIATGAETVSIRWSAVREIVVYKLDLLTTDEIRLRRDLDISPFSVEVSEEMDGFENFRSVAEKYFHFPEAWWSQVLQPTFATNARVLCSRAKSPEAS